MDDDGCRRRIAQADLLQDGQDFHTPVVRRYDYGYRRYCLHVGQLTNCLGRFPSVFMTERALVCLAVAPATLSPDATSRLTTAPAPITAIGAVLDVSGQLQAGHTLAEP
jgi:hypothetical protein